MSSGSAARGTDGRHRPWSPRPRHGHLHRLHRGAPAVPGPDRPGIRRRRGRRLEVVTSAVALLETLVVPYRAGDADLAERYEAVLTRSRGVRLVDLDRPLLRSAAQLRAAAPVKTPDALQLAAALRARCTAYLGSDRALLAIPGLRVLQLRDYARSR